MNQKKVGFIGWRGLVGSVLRKRLQEEKNFNFFKTFFFSTSNPGGKAPSIETSSLVNPQLLNAFSLSDLKKMDILISTQGGDYTQNIFFKLREEGWDGYWVDAASTLRLEKNACIVVDPINKNIIDQKLKENCKNFIGSNCTTAIMLMGVGGLIQAGLVEWITSMSYQAISGAGAKAMLEMLEQMNYLCQNLTSYPFNPLVIEKEIKNIIKNPNYPKKIINHPLVGSLLTWIDSEVENGQSREEKKIFEETNKIFNLSKPIPIDGICVRVPTLRCHSKALTIKLKKNIDLEKIEEIITHSHPWVKIIPNNKKDTLEKLTPLAVSETLNIHVGRLRKMNLGNDYLSAFIVGDQLLWGAAEPLRRILLILLKK